MKEFFTWRRVLWYGLLAAVGWGLYLLVPPKPRWVLAEQEAPLLAKGRRLLSVVSDQADAKSCEKVSLRSLDDGELLSEAPAPNNGWRLTANSANLRFVVFSDSANQSAISVHDLLSGNRWTKSNANVHGFSPRGAILQVGTGDNSWLLEAASGHTVFEFGREYCGYYLEHFASDDSWALFTNGPKTDWMLWRRDTKRVAHGKFPGTVYRLQVAPDERLAAIQCLDENQLLLWDVLQGQIRRVLQSPCHNYLAFVFAPDSSRLAAWNDFQSKQPRAQIDFFEVATGKCTSARAETRVSRGSFSPDGRLFSYDLGDARLETVVIAVPGLVERWRRSIDRLVFSSPIWLPAGDNRMLVPRSAGDGSGFSGGPIQSGAYVLQGENGRELFARPRGTLLRDNKVLSVQDEATAAQAFGLPEALVRWLPWVKDKNYTSLSVFRLDSGVEVFRRAYEHSADASPPVNPFYCDGTTLVLVRPGHDTEIWDLPPARRWLWILGPPAALAALPWLRWRKRNEAVSSAKPPANLTPGCWTPP